MCKIRNLALAALVTLLPAGAMAHTGQDHAFGIVHGFLHPLGGLDHLLAMLAVGLLAWHLGARARWLVPAAFLVAMALGGALGMGGLALPFVEVGIALSVIVVGGLVALGRSLPTALVMGLVGVFALFHGHAHGAEMGAVTSGLGYGLGFLAATGLLHAAGLLLGAGLEAADGRHFARASGAAIAIAGIVMLAGLA